ncbi:hypothetical protein PTKIN_Ptkin07bG0243900 [Pterospermum kingtungense]
MPETELEKLDLAFPDGPYPAQGKSNVEGIFDPSYYEWFQANQGAILSATLPGMQRDILTLSKVLRIKCLIIISGAKFGGSKFGHHKLTSTAFSSPIECPSLHIIGELDFMKQVSSVHLESFVDPFVINHISGHTVPKLDEKSKEVILAFIDRIHRTMPRDEVQIFLNAEAN